MKPNVYVRVKSKGNCFASTTLAEDWTVTVLFG